MKWSTKYMDDSLFYEAWKTKFVEKFCVQTFKLILEYKKLKKEQKIPDEIFVNKYLTQYAVMINILKRKLKADGCSLTLSSDVIYAAYKNNLITNKKTYFDIINFRQKLYIDKNYYKNFKNDYIVIMEDFLNLFKKLAKTEGVRKNEYRIYDNSSCLWGLKEKYYKKIINCFLDFENLKIVRIFGSRVTDEYSDFSDIDLICEGTYTPKEYYELIDKIYSLNIPYIIDVYDIHRKSVPFMYRNVVRSNIFYSRKNYAKDDYVTILN